MTDQAEVISLPPRLRISAAMEYFGVSRSTIYRREKAGLLTILKSGNISTVKTAEMLALFKARTVGPGE